MTSDTKSKNDAAHQTLKYMSLVTLTGQNAMLGSAANRLIGEVVQSRRRPLLEGLLLVESSYYRFHI